ncbi:HYPOTHETICAL PROTEIN MCJ_000720 [Mesomycoplasma conjunctivae]|uniref:Uncharacterized protein n=1 Tax=Mesomycoplasma conjunctivae (strain ATCC 25834 / NCTC 10147 / HRC/581) TaxID=572263 RepID=C5J5M4_MESCH|nr:HYPOTHETICAL PROTEIN MCJ_000720 [Mesomycoplasma conjunctivae]
MISSIESKVISLQDTKAIGRANGIIDDNKILFRFFIIKFIISTKKGLWWKYLKNQTFLFNFAIKMKVF